jgi:hypothetical protein
MEKLNLRPELDTAISIAPHTAPIGTVLWCHSDSRELRFAKYAHGRVQIASKILLRCIVRSG